MIIESDNCMVCAEEFSLDELKSVALSTFFVTRFKICKNCLEQADPENDYQEVRSIINSFEKINK